LRRGWVCLLWLCLAFRIAHVTCYLKFLILHYNKSCASTGFGKHIMATLYILCYNGSLMTWTVVSLTTTKFYILLTGLCVDSPNTASALTQQKHCASVNGDVMSLVKLYWHSPPRAGTPGNTASRSSPIAWRHLCRGDDVFIEPFPNSRLSGSAV
jgi:hypothetical protein